MKNIKTWIHPPNAYGYLGRKKRISLSACAYTTFRKHFQLKQARGLVKSREQQSTQTEFIILYAVLNVLVDFLPLLLIYKVSLMFFIARQSYKIITSETWELVPNSKNSNRVHSLERGLRVHLFCASLCTFLPSLIAVSQLSYKVTESWN